MTSKRWLILVALAIAYPLSASPSNSQTHSQTAPTVVCPKLPGFFPRPFVPTERAAKAIYTAIALEIMPAKLREFPIVTVEDDGDRWIVSQTRYYPPKKLPPNTVGVTMGGGQLVMNINKCTGTVSEVYLAR